MAQLTITTTSQQDARIVAAFGSYLGLGRNATGPEVKASVINHIKQVVYDYERREAVATAEASITQVDPT